MATTLASQARMRAIRAIKPIWHKADDQTPSQDFQMMLDRFEAERCIKYTAAHFGFEDGSVAIVYLASKWFRSNNPDARPVKYHKAGISAYRLA